MHEISANLWASKYAAYEGETFEQGCERVVKLSDGYMSVEDQARLYEYMVDRKFLPGGRILYAAGMSKPQFANCALFRVGDSKEDWGNAVRDSIISLCTGMGVGNEVSRVRPAGAPITGLGGIASGSLTPVSIINSAARDVIQGGSRRSACHAALDVFHPDFETWLNAKVWTSDQWKLKEKDYDHPAPFDIHNLSIRYHKLWAEAYENPHHSLHHMARDRFRRHLRVMFEHGDPNIQYDWDHQILRNACCEVISAKSFETCILGSVNLPNIRDVDELSEVTEMATKFLLTVKFINNYPLPEMREASIETMRIGLGFMGLHNWFLQRGLSYAWCGELREWLEVWRTSAFDTAGKYCKLHGWNHPHGILSVAPTGSISTLADLVSSGIQRIFAVAYLRRYFVGMERRETVVIDPWVLGAIQRGELRSEDVVDITSETPQDFEDAIRLQYYVQGYVDNAISQTLNLSSWGGANNNETTLKQYQSSIERYILGLRGLTVYPDGARPGQPLEIVSFRDALSILEKDETRVSVEATYSCGSTMCAA